MFSLMGGSAVALALAGAVILALFAGAVSAVGAVATAEQFPGEGRITGLALGATMATAIFGGLTPYGAQWLVERTGWVMAPGAMIAVVAIAVLPILWSMRETAPTANRTPSAPS
jgi:MHS family proline/betaine transporter-like MFS transporter